MVSLGGRERRREREGGKEGIQYLTQKQLEKNTIVWSSTVNQVRKEGTSKEIWGGGNDRDYHGPPHGQTDHKVCGSVTTPLS